MTFLYGHKCSYILYMGFSVLKIYGQLSNTKSDVGVSRHIRTTHSWKVLRTFLTDTQLSAILMYCWKKRNHIAVAVMWHLLQFSLRQSVHFSSHYALDNKETPKVKGKYVRIWKIY